ncbi:MAG: hypothetical protein K2N63_06180 [Lachnospiraceae bacterium]|nr:hypothetical protein [Lachnospiraceae bacterium]
MVEEKLQEFLCQETAVEELGNESLLHGCPEFGQMIGKAINDGNLVPFSVELSGHLEEMDLYKASLLSNFIGFVCEKEGDTSAGEGVVRLFAAACTKVYDLFRSTEVEGECQLPPDLPELYAKNREWAKAYYGFNVLCVSTMAFLTRDPELRRFLAQFALDDQIDFLVEETPESPYLKSIFYVGSMLKTCSNLKLLVLQPGRQQGFYATANDINNCFHLLFLMEEQIVKNCCEKYGAKNFLATDSMVRLAHGEYPDDVWKESYTTCFMECNYTSADHASFKNDDAMALIWGEMSPQEIPVVDGRAVIVLLDDGPSRSFSASFLMVQHEALNPYVRIEEELSEEEYKIWMEKIGNIMGK